MNDTDFLIELCLTNPPLEKLTQKDLIRYVKILIDQNKYLRHEIVRLENIVEGLI